VLTDTDPTAQVVLIGEGDNVPQVLLDAANNVVALSDAPRTIESRCMSPEVQAAVKDVCYLFRRRQGIRRGKASPACG